MIEFQVNALPGINPLEFIFMKLYSKLFQTLKKCISTYSFDFVSLSQQCYKKDLEQCSPVGMGSILPYLGEGNVYSNNKTVIFDYNIKDFINKCITFNKCTYQSTTR